MRWASAPFGWAEGVVIPVRLPRLSMRAPRLSPGTSRLLDRLWIVLVVVVTAAVAAYAAVILSHTLDTADALKVLGLGAITLVRVLVLIAIATLIWVPIGVWVGLRPAWAERIQPFAQFLAAFPANVLFPVAVVTIVALNLNPDIWLSPLMVLGTQWYILFNVIAGASALPTDLKEAGAIFGVRSWQWWRQIGLPGIFPTMSPARSPPRAVPGTPRSSPNR